MIETNILHNAEIRIHEAMPKNNRLGKALKYVLIVAILSWISVLSSCVVAVRNPQYDRNGVVIVRHNHRDRHYRSERPYKSERHARYVRHKRHDRHDRYDRHDRND